MKNRSVFLAIAAVLVAVGLASCASTAKEIPLEKRLVVAVAGVEGAPVASSSWDEALVGELLKAKRLRVMERSRLDALLKENELSLSALSDSAGRKKMFSVIGADGILLVSVTEIREYAGKESSDITGWWSDVSLGIEAKVSARLASVSSGEILAASNASGKAEAGKFNGAMGLYTVNKSRDELVVEAVSKALQSVARSIARSAPARE
jgi:curli biogenesis system outer membrane secretion channel CsgG